MAGRAIFIIPGYKHRPKNKAYRQISKMLKNEGYSPISVKIPWRQTTISENCEYFLREYKKINSRKKYILGFSFGAMIAFIASTKVQVSGLILCSLSPYFREDLPKLDSKSISSLTDERYQDFSKLKCSILAKHLKARQVLMLYGTEEEKILIRRVNLVFDRILKRKRLIPIKETDHNLGDKRYLSAIFQVAKTLN